jgi:cell division protein FtsI (penicillin-binding protein 3)
VVCRLYCIQIRHADFYANLGEKQYNVTLTIYPPRAPIFDRSGNHMLALNKDSIAAFILPKTIEHHAQLESFLKRHFHSAYERLKRNGTSNFMYIARRLTPEQIALISKADIDDIKLLNESGRFYPNESAAPLIGITDIDNKGLFGLELVYDKQLAGTPTTQTLQKDARSGRFYFTHETKIRGHEGTAIRCTIDNDLQFLAFEELVKTVEQCHAKEGSIIVMNPVTGEILAMAHIPTFNPNDTRTLDMDRTKNPIITETYELGSVIKVLATLAALEEGVVTPDELIDCEGVKTTYIDGRKVNTVPSSVAGVIPFHQVIEKSNNIGIAKVVRKLGPRLYDHYIRMGFGHKTQEFYFRVNQMALLILLTTGRNNHSFPYPMAMRFQQVSYNLHGPFALLLMAAMR